MIPGLHMYVQACVLTWKGNQCFPGAPHRNRCPRAPLRRHLAAVCPRSRCCRKECRSSPIHCRSIPHRRCCQIPSPFLWACNVYAAKVYFLRRSVIAFFTRVSVTVDGQSKDASWLPTGTRKSAIRFGQGLGAWEGQLRFVPKVSVQQKGLCNIFNWQFCTMYGIRGFLLKNIYSFDIRTFHLYNYIFLNRTSVNTINTITFVQLLSKYNFIQPKIVYSTLIGEKMGIHKHYNANLELQFSDLHLCYGFVTLKELYFSIVVQILQKSVANNHNYFR